ncbi:MAG: transcriptional regulator [Selenomonadales bacterium]|jgi:DNA-binding helix-turn-helix protein|nr:helix-turn-helix transcriptional regulator [Clostridiales bacterium]PWL99492.1 MAG: transcriptional regulator [Selenomonadales bacterium]
MNRDYEKIVGNKIRSIRAKKEITQDELASMLQVKNCDITRSALAKIEVGQRHIYIDELKVIKEVLKVSYEDLLN